MEGEREMIVNLIRWLLNFEYDRRKRFNKCSSSQIMSFSDWVIGSFAGRPSKVGKK
jgi:hypothetical protein